MPRFTLPRDIYYGRGTLAELKNIEGSRAMIVLGGGSMRRFGFVDKAESFLAEAGIKTQIFENVEPDPSIETVLKGAAAMREFEPDIIISMGGGSPIDAAKAMWVFYEYPEIRFEELCVPFSFPKLRKKAKFIAIPSTSGTATEVTAFSVITDYKTGIKYPLADFNITPDIAIVDPELALTMPKELTAHTGMDALTHAIEAYVSLMNSPFTDPLALKAIKMIFEYLPASYNGDEAAREQMHYAQCIAGMAFTNALLGIVHSMAHKTGAAFENHLPHGMANAMYLPYVIKFNAAHSKKRYMDIAKAAGIDAANEEEGINLLCQKIKEFNAYFGIPLSLKEAGIDEKEFLKKIDGIAKRAVEDACTLTNPREISQEEMKHLFLCIYYGEDLKI